MHSSLDVSDHDGDADDDDDFDGENDNDNGDGVVTTLHCVLHSSLEVLVQVKKGRVSFKATIPLMIETTIYVMN